LPFGTIRPFCTFLKPLSFRRHFLLTNSLSRTGFLDTFDPFDSPCGDLPGDFLDLA
jgi:hypothetical protein